MATKVNFSNLVARLRDLESQALALAHKDIAPSQAASKETYEERIERLEKSHSRSWFGDHSSTYYGNFEPPPDGRSFDVEWGFIPGFNGSRNPGWRRYSRDDIKAFTFADIGEDIHDAIQDLAEEIVAQFSNIRDQSLDVVEILASQIKSNAITRYKDVLEKTTPYSFADYVNGCIKTAPNMTRDSKELAKGRMVPAHVQYWAPFQSIDVNRRRLGEVASTIRKTIESITLAVEIDTPMTSSSTIFLGHGRSEQWRVLKDFIKDRLNLAFEEFNRISPAGINTQERLGEMLDRCGFAFLVFTAEDAHVDESLHARENVIHEAGLFQGRVGWRRAIILLEEGCEEFSNIVGLGQIRFAKGNVSSCFEEVRRVLEREGFIKAGP